LHEITDKEPFTGVLCFQHHTPGDLMIGTAKIAGSAQRKQRGALLQHGAILLTRSPHAPALPGIGELAEQVPTVPEICQAIQSEFSQQTGWELVAGAVTQQELTQVEELIRTRYGQA